ncbi:hypothetical protein AN5171.2 [Aspergillus nidulans FGSC A4]|uniref:Uncharacterized protein n=1 Tax=Emericella nidulans (strain FGSC A4 / ATCC 38163 / CBS 112.46 / NRRL 194 / M139) TaxID=227321 RepID=Q5B2Q9_EMENI|nr:hypothetical protein [Aspergillus nidulans FGSC A4]EAA62352.1 hypothetical protein AN5171.2 [Aspergillus nidulans FGSC A4]CBF81008.1 TPA: conserved hypothetical protein [Aspergillus nidulans FGSC A4]|eukprot:XP_662775.1 hypothetical protein AN5171.2 [Aspergillus nidulans FGSC A4]
MDFGASARGKAAWRQRCILQTLKNKLGRNVGTAPAAMEFMAAFGLNPEQCGLSRSLEKPVGHRHLYGLIRACLNLARRFMVPNRTRVSWQYRASDGLAEYGTDAAPLIKDLSCLWRIGQYASCPLGEVTRNRTALGIGDLHLLCLH